MHFWCIYGCLRYKYVIVSVFEQFQGLGRPCKSGLKPSVASREVVNFHASREAARLDDHPKGLATRAAKRLALMITRRG